MPKDKVEEPKKKMVVVEEVSVEQETPKEESTVEVETKVVDKKVEPVAVNIEAQDEEEEKTSYLWIIIPTALLIGALVGGLITYFSGLSKLNADATPSPVASALPEVSPEPTIAPESNIKREEIKLQVLNGSGVSGLAGKAKIYLEGLGYVSVQTGNAANSNFTETVVAVKDSKKEFTESVVADLSKNYKVAEKTEVLPASSKYDFVITLGSK